MARSLACALSRLSVLCILLSLAAEMDADLHLDGLFRACFSRQDLIQQNEEVIFSVRGIDGARDVTLTFKVEGSQSGLACTLEWVKDDSDSLNSKGDIRSIQVSDNSLTTPIYDISSKWPTEIKITLLTVISSEDSDFDYMIVRRLYPNGLVSARFIKEFLLVLENRYNTNNGIPLLTVIEKDDSNIRELYWLQKGQTYFEEIWGLEYHCLLLLPDEERDAILQISADALNLPALTALGQGEEFPHYRGYAPILKLNPVPNEDSHFRFNARFIGALESFRRSKSQDEFESMTVRDVVREFTATWTVGPNGLFTQKDITMMARNTFMYFFRRHSNFSSIARQVMYGYDASCSSMTGLVKEENTRQFQFRFERRVIPPFAPPPSPDEPQQAEGSSSVSANVPDSIPEKHLSATINFTSNINFFILLLTCISNIYIFFCSRKGIHKSSDTLLHYSEL